MMGEGHYQIKKRRKEQINWNLRREVIERFF